MPLYLTDEQQMLRDTARDFVAEHAPVSHMRALRDANDATGFSRDLWKQFAELGLTGITIPESHGGIGMGATEAALVLEEIGRNLTPSPFLATAIVGARAIAGTQHADRWHPLIAAGDAILALAVDEGARHAPQRVALEARREGNGFLLNGTKQFVVQGGSADMIVTAARTAGSPGETDGITLFAVPNDAAGLDIESESLVDSS